MEIQKIKPPSLNERINEILKTTEGKTYTAAIATLVLVALMIIFAVVPAYSSITDQLASNAAKTQYLDEMTAKQKTIGTLVAQEDQNELSIKLFDIYFKTKINNEFLVASFSKLAEQYKCKLANITFDKVRRSTNIKNLNQNVYAIGFNLSVSCKINDLNSLFAKITNFPVPVYINSITYGNKRDTTATGAVNLFGDKFNTVITGEYYFWNDPTSDANNQLTNLN